MIPRWSKYNFLFRKEGHCFLYSSLSNSFALLDDETYDLLCGVRDGNQSEITDNDLVQTLSHMQAINVDEDLVINLIRFISQKRKFDQESLYLTINPTLSCNFRCPYCFETEHHDRFMSDETEDAIISYVKKKGSLKHLNVMWFGGEPLLGFKRIKSLTNRLSGIVENYSAAMISNGYLLTPEVVASLEDLQIRMIQITLDGLATSHDKKRCLKSGAPTFDRIIDNITHCLKNAPSVRIVIRVNINNDNPDDYLQVYDYFASNGISGVEVVPGFIVDRENDIPTCAFNHKQIVNFACKTFRDHKIKSISFFPSIMRNSCSARNINSLVIGPDGELYKCWEEVGRNECIVGNIKESTYNRGLMLRYTAGIDQLDDSQCIECRLLPICDGGCPRVRLLNKYEGRHLETCHLLKDGMEDLLYCHYLSKRQKTTE
ncbi:MAG: SPASM domain-containing protein [Muribaculaceae bacterium]|nr:SPASM domain-containing protein [Muribaculaceae bacterium]